MQRFDEGSKGLHAKERELPLSLPLISHREKIGENRENQVRDWDIEDLIRLHAQRKGKKNLKRQG